MLVEVVLFLRAFHLLLHARANAALDLKNFDLTLHQLQKFFEAFGRISDLKNLLLVFKLEIEVRDHEVSQTRRLVDGVHAHEHLGWDAFIELHVVFESSFEGTNESFELNGVVIGVLNLFDDRFNHAIVFRVGDDTSALLPFDQHLHGVVGEAQNLKDRAESSDFEDVLLTRADSRRLTLSNQEEVLLLVHALFESVDGLFATYEKWHHHMRENNDVTKWKERYLYGRWSR